ncbi:cysteine methyltransferase [Bacillus methanolicus]|uniref:methylated-DNA--[protein]-cysteine S-methyltransferase n=1 Tax=Bacillus methanolicus TaxID=1471 RepID=UPI00237FE5C3|nr:methylated-DNA--[protein]-cysteine S-methyltransferase [Bacillus methanolicus]MDE3838307.1 cysteine methyltransferase [Bacillus methanolicus]
MRKYTICPSEIGNLYIVAEDEQLAAIHIGEDDFNVNETSEEIVYDPDHPILLKCVCQLNEYFEGKRKNFDLPLKQVGTDFQLAVWNQLIRIPFGETRSYRDIAEKVGRPKAVRAVGQANKANMFPIIVPCHRVIGKNKSLTGYAGNRVDIKEKLLLLEKAEFKSNEIRKKKKQTV